MAYNTAQYVGAGAGAVGTGISVAGQLYSGRMAVVRARQRGTLIRAGARNQSNDILAAGRGAATDAQTVLAGYQLEKAVRADRATRQAAQIRSQFAKSGISLDSDSVRAIEEDQAGVVAEQERLARFEVSSRISKLTMEANNAEVAARNTRDVAEAENLLLMQQAKEAKRASEIAAVGEAFSGVAGIARMFA